MKVSPIQANLHFRNILISLVGERRHFGSMGLRERSKMADLNKVFLMGRLTFDPEVRYTPGGMAVADLRMATSRTWNGKDGDRKEETLYVDVTVWDRQAENCGQYLRKGSGIHVEGSLKMDTWEDKTTGEKRSKIKVSADRVQFLDRRPDGPSDGGSAPTPSREPERRQGGPSSPTEPSKRTSYSPPTGSPGRSPALSEADDEDIPF